MLKLEKFKLQVPQLQLVLVSHNYAGGDKEWAFPPPPQTPPQRTNQSVRSCTGENSNGIFENQGGVSCAAKHNSGRRLSAFASAHLQRGLEPADLCCAKPA